jgi:hypothetical protein
MVARGSGDNSRIVSRYGANPLNSSTTLDDWGRSLAWIRHQPPELGIPGSNPGGPATLSSRFLGKSDFICLFLTFYFDMRFER